MNGPKNGAIDKIPDKSPQTKYLFTPRNSKLRMYKQDKIVQTINCPLIYKPNFVFICFIISIIDFENIRFKNSVKNFSILSQSFNK